MKEWIVKQYVISRADMQLGTLNCWVSKICQSYDEAWTHLLDMVISDIAEDHCDWYTDYEKKEYIIDKVELFDISKRCLYMKYKKVKYIYTITVL